MAPNQTSEDSRPNKLASKTGSEFTEGCSCDTPLQTENFVNNHIISSEQNNHDRESISFNYDNRVSVLQQRDENCLKTLFFNNGINGTLHFLNPSSYQINSLSEYIDINSLSLPHSIIPSLLNNEQSSQENIEAAKDADKPDNLNRQEKHETQEKTDDEGIEKNEEEKENAAEGSQTPSSSDSSLTQSSARRRRKRRTFGEKRKNPVRKAQITKASLDLIEKLTIPPSVFNARIKRGKTKPNIIDVVSKLIFNSYLRN